MPKITKREYEKKMNELKKIQKELILKEEVFISDQDKGKEISSEEWNSLYDAQWDTAKKMEELESEWDRRNWTSSDYNSYSLVQSNID